MLEMSVVSTDLDVLEKFHAIADCGNVRSVTKPSHKPHYKPQWVWGVSGVEAIWFADLLRPWLCSRRTARLDEIVQAIHDSLPTEKECSCCAKRFTPKRFQTTALLRD